MSSLLNLSRYPISRRGSEQYHQLLRKCRESLRQHGCCRLPEFVLPAGVQEMQTECHNLINLHDVQGNQNGRSVNCYYTLQDQDKSSDHPQNKFFDREFGVIRNDMISQDASTVRAIYNDPALMAFAADLLEVPRLFQSRDSYQALTVNVMGEGEHLHWHFDCNSCAITLGIQEPVSGGELEFVCDIGRDNVEAIKEVINDSAAPVHSAEFSRGQHATHPGELIFFRGGHSIHRVRQVHGDKLRIVAALQFNESDDAYDDPAMTERIYGVPQSEHLGPRPSSSPQYARL